MATGAGVGVAVGGTRVGVAVAGGGVTPGGNGVGVAGIRVAVAVGGMAVAVGGTAVAVGGTRVGVAVGGIGVGVALAEQAAKTASNPTTARIPSTLVQCLPRASMLNIPLIIPKKPLTTLRDSFFLCAAVPTAHPEPTRFSPRPYRLADANIELYMPLAPYCQAFSDVHPSSAAASPTIYTKPPIVCRCLAASRRATVATTILMPVRITPYIAAT